MREPVRACPVDEISQEGMFILISKETAPQASKVYIQYVSGQSFEKVTDNPSEVHSVREICPDHTYPMATASPRA